MIGEINIWQFLAGLGVFLLGMSLIEEALETLAGRTFKRFLRRHTKHPIKAIGSGILVTVILQSSSVVSLMVLAFVGAGVIELKNAIGVIIGSNLGTTFTGWVVAYFGFSLDLESAIMPMLAIGGLSVAFLNQRKWYQHLGRFLIGLGFLLMGLMYMKEGMDIFAQKLDLSILKESSPYWMFFVGFVLTAIIQSSSAAMVITLSALSAGIFTLPAAAAMVIGNDLGTTVTTMIGGIKGTKSKKRVALGQVLFNFIIDVFALIFLIPLLNVLIKIFGTSDPLILLVAFHSSFNLIGILIFLPFIGRFAKFLEKRFVSENDQIAKFINNVPTSVPDAALESLTQEVKHLIERVFLLHFNILEVHPPVTFSSSMKKINSEIDISQQYNYIKELEGELVDFYVKIQNEPLQSEESHQLKHLLVSIRHSMSAAKSIKDIWHNVESFNRSVNESQIELFDFMKFQQRNYYFDLFGIFQEKSSKKSFDQHLEFKELSKKNYDLFLDKTYTIIRKGHLSDIEIATMFNVNREVHGANKSLVNAVREYMEVISEEELLNARKG